MYTSLVTFVIVFAIALFIILRNKSTASCRGFLDIYTSPYHKRRLGTRDGEGLEFRNGDGGYIIADLPIVYDTFLSGGIETNTDFENDFLEKYEYLACHAFDGSISNLPNNADRRIILHKKFINKDNNLESFLKYSNNAFVKMDIEGGEYEWLETLPNRAIQSIAQLIIEWHGPYDERRLNIIRKMSNTHVLIHVHGNNCGGVQANLPQNHTLPLALECTYIRKDFVPKLIPSKSNVPSEIDATNCKGPPILYDSNTCKWWTKQ